MPAEIDDFVCKLEQRVQDKGCRFYFSNFVCDLIREYRDRELRDQKTSGSG